MDDVPRAGSLANATADAIEIASHLDLSAADGAELSRMEAAHV